MLGIFPLLYQQIFPRVRLIGERGNLYSEFRATNSEILSTAARTEGVDQLGKINIIN